MCGCLRVKHSKTCWNITRTISCDSMFADGSLHFIAQRLNATPSPRPGRKMPPTAAKRTGKVLGMALAHAALAWVIPVVPADLTQIYPDVCEGILTNDMQKHAKASYPSSPRCHSLDEVSSQTRKWYACLSMTHEMWDKCSVMTDMNAICRDAQKCTYRNQRSAQFHDVMWCDCDAM